MIKRILLSFLFVTAVLKATDAEKVIENIRKKFNSIESFSAEIVAMNPAGNENFKGKFFYYKPDYYKIILPEREIISIADTIWSFEKSRKRVVITVRDETTPFFDIREILFREAAKYKIKLLKKRKKFRGKYVLKVLPKEGTEGNAVYIGVDKNFLVCSLQTESNGTPGVRFEFKNFVLNKLKKNSVFKIQIPVKWETVDLR